MIIDISNWKLKNVNMKIDERYKVSFMIRLLSFHLHKLVLFHLLDIEYLEVLIMLLNCINRVPGWYEPSTSSIYTFCTIMSNSNKKQVKNYTLDQLKEGIDGPVVVMICRTWDVHNINGRYLSTDFVVSDEKVKFI